MEFPANLEVNTGADTGVGRQVHHKMGSSLLYFLKHMLFSGNAEVCEWFDDQDGKFHIQVDVRNEVWGPLFGYRGSFEVRWASTTEKAVPKEMLPARCERRE